MDRSPSVWPLPLSLATTYGISFDFSSWAYLDVSVQPVFPRTPMYSVHDAWVFGPCVFPHSEIHGSKDICSSPWLIAACHVLLRRLVPRHSPCALSNLTYLNQHLCLIRYGSFSSNYPKHIIDKSFLRLAVSISLSAFVL